MPILPVILAAASIAGAIGSARGTKYIDEAWLEKMTGSRKYAELFNGYLAHLQSSPEGQNMYRAADNAASQIVNSTIATGGAGASGEQTGMQALGVALAPQVSNNLRNQVSGSLAQQAGKMAQQTITDRLSAYLNDKGRQTESGKIWGAIGQAAGIGLNAGWGAGQGTGGTTKTDGSKDTSGSDGNGTTPPATPPSGPSAPATPPPAPTPPAAPPPPDTKAMSRNPSEEGLAMAMGRPARQQQMLNFKPVRNSQAGVGGGTGRFRGTTYSLPQAPEA